MTAVKLHCQIVSRHAMNTRHKPPFAHLKLPKKVNHAESRSITKHEIHKKPILVYRAMCDLENDGLEINGRESALHDSPGSNLTCTSKSDSASFSARFSRSSVSQRFFVSRGSGDGFGQLHRSTHGFICLTIFTRCTSHDIIRSRLDPGIGFPTLSRAFATLLLVFHDVAFPSEVHYHRGHKRST